MILLYPYNDNIITLSTYIQQNLINDTSTGTKVNIINKYQSILFYTVSLCSILNYLHRKCIIFRNLSPENIQIDINGYILIRVLRLQEQKLTYNTTRQIVVNLVKKKYNSIF